MKYLIFFIFSVASMPMMTMAAVSNKFCRNALICLMIFSTVLGDITNINFLSYELYRGPDRGFEINLSDLIAVALLLSYLIRAYSRVNWLPYNSFFLFLIFGVAVLSFLVNSGKLFSLFTLFKLMKAYLVFVCMANIFRVGINKKSVWYALLLIGFFLTILAFYQKYGIGVYRVYGSFDHSNTIPLYLNMILPLLLIWTLCDKSLRSYERFLSGVCAVGMLFSIAATFSRGGVAISILSIASILTLVNIKLHSKRTFFISFVFFLIFLGGTYKVSDSFMDRIMNAPESSATARHEFELSAFEMAQDNLLGVGINNFSLAMTNNSKYRLHLEVMENEDEAGVAHHIYLLTAAEIGIVGLVFFLIIMVRFLLVSLRIYRKGYGGERFLGFGLFVGIVSILLSGFLEWGFRTTPVMYLFMMLAGFSVALEERHRFYRANLELETARSCDVV